MEVNSRVDKLQPFVGVDGKKVTDFERRRKKYIEGGFIYKTEVGQTKRINRKGCRSTLLL